MRMLIRPILAATVSAAALFAQPAVAAPAATDSQNGTMRVLSLNTWIDRFRPNPAARMSEFLLNGDYDVLTFQELRANSTYLTTIPALLQANGRGTFTTGQVADNGVASRMPGSHGAHRDGVSIAYQNIDAGRGLPDTIVGTVHLNYFDPSTYRVGEARAINAFGAATHDPIILTGDFNAGDVAERGLLSVNQQKRVLASYLTGGNTFYGRLVGEYAVDPAAMDAFVAANRGRSLALADIPDALFAPETYPVASNTPQTMNILKKDYILLQNESEREPWAPHDLGDGSTTWPSAAEDATNVWPSWDRTKIDHFIVSRGAGKWYQLADDPADQYVGVLDQTGFANDGTPLSDHEAVAHVMKWTGPALESLADGRKRLVWGDDAASFGETGGTFRLDRNNMRSDVYLGQVSDANGMPTLIGLTLTEKKTRLNCADTSGRFAAAVAEYCIDDHGFVGETLVKDGGTVIVTEDAAMGDRSAGLRLRDGGTLRIEGTAMAALDRAVALETGGGRIDVAARAANVTAVQTISGDGGLTKAGAGTLQLDAANRYTGATEVLAGRLEVNGNNSRSALTTVHDGAVLAGSGMTGDMSVLTGGIINAVADSLPSVLTVAGDLKLAGGSIIQVLAGPMGNSLLNVVGDLVTEGRTVIRLDLMAGWIPDRSMVLEFLHTRSQLSPALLGDVRLVLPDVKELADLRLYTFGGRAALAFADPYGGGGVIVPAPIPVPPAGLALISALGLGALLRRRRART